MKRLQRTLGVILAISVAGACSEGSGNDPVVRPDSDIPSDVDAGVDADPGDKTLTGIVATPASAALLVGGTQQIEVNGTYSDGSSGALGDGLTFASSADAVATVSVAGLVTAVGGGDATITVNHGAFSDTVAINVTAGIVRDVFADNYGEALSYAPFGGSFGAPTVDPTTPHNGSASLKVTLPPDGYIGGAIVAAEAVDLTPFTAVSFWARADAVTNLDKVGIGNDSVIVAHQAEFAPVPLTTEWQRFVFPIPATGLLTAEKGLFYFAEGKAELGGASTIWFDDIRFESEPSVGFGTQSPAIATETVSKLTGDTFTVRGTSLAWDVDTTAKVLALSPAYFTFTSSDPLVATVSAAGVVTALAPGTTIITAKLGTVDAVGMINLTVGESSEPDAPNTPPTVPATDVISLFSGAYTDVIVDTWSASWDGADLLDTTILTDAVKKYTNLNFAGIEFTGTHSIDATAMTHLHLDVWTPDAAEFTVRLVDFGADNAYGGGDDKQDDVVFNATSTPVLVKKGWNSFDIPLASYEVLTSRAHLSQMLFLATGNTVYVDNVYFHK